MSQHNNIKDVLLEKVAQGLKAVATCYLEMSSSTQQMCWPSMERLLLLQHRSKDVLSEFSGYYCLRLLLDNESPLATFFIDLFHELEWLLDTMQKRGGNSSSLENLYAKIRDLNCSIQPAADSCRNLYARVTGCSQFSTGKEMKREGKLRRDFSMDGFRRMTKMLSFVNLDQSNYNKVELGKMLGRGGYGAVYEGHFVARNQSYQPLMRITGEPVAVKVFSDCTDAAGPSRSIGSQFFDQMEKMVELQKMKTNGHSTSSTTSAAKRLHLEELWKLVSAKHPNIVTARGYIGNRPQGEGGLVMELMDTSLQEYLEKVKEPLEELEMIDLMLEIAKGMRFLHECGLMHRDLKPGNILLRSHKKLGRCEKYPAMEVKLADFGLTQYFVQDVQQSAVDTTPGGTPCYMAPEVLHMSADYEASYQDKVDVFSYGTTCFNILMCEIPRALDFTRCSKATSAEFYNAVKSKAWRKGVEGKPEYLIDLIARCWDFDPSRRPTFATICFHLQRAMLCILSPPLINLTALSYVPLNNQDSKMLESYRRIDRRLRKREVIGTRTMESCKGELERDIQGRGHMRSNLSLVEWNINRGGGGVSLLQRLAGLSLKQSKEELFDAIDDEANVEYVDASNSFTTPVVRAKVEEPADRFWRIPLKTMDPEWIFYKALVYNAMLDSSLGRRAGGALLNSSLGRAGGPLLHVDPDKTLIPFLMCFWEGHPPMTLRLLFEAFLEEGRPKKSPSTEP